MKNKTPWWVVRAVLALALSTGIVAQAWAPEHFSGVINDYTPATTVTPAGPWEVRGPWSLTFKGEHCKADFQADVSMLLSDYSRNPSNVDATSGASSRAQHTHHITMEDGVVTQLSGGGYEVTGPVSITKDGSPAPFAATTAVINITGGTSEEFSNITLTFQGGATAHFGTQALHGVISNASK